MSATVELFEAIAKENVAAMKESLRNGANWKAAYGAGDRDVLLDHGVPLLHQPKGCSDKTLLHRAAAFSRMPVIRMRVRRGIAADHRRGEVPANLLTLPGAKSKR